MPADKFTNKATTSSDKRQWDHVYKSAKAKGASSGAAIRQANGVIKQKKG